MGFAHEFLQGFTGNTGMTPEQRAIAAEDRATARQKQQGIDSSTEMTSILDSLKPKPLPDQISPIGLQNTNVDWKPKMEEKRSPLERQKAMATRMIQSPNSHIQEQGYAMLAKYQGTATKPVIADKGTSTMQNYKMAKTEGFQGSMIDYIKATKGPGVTVNNNSPEKGYSVTDAGKLLYKDGTQVMPGTLPSVALERGIKYKPAAEENKNFGKFQVMSDSFDELDALISNPEFNTDQLEGLMSNFRTEGGAISDLADYLLTGMGVPLSPTNAKYISNIKNVNSSMLNMLSGQSSTDPEYQRIKSQLPQLGQNKELFKSNYIATKRNFERMRENLEKGRGLFYKGKPVSEDKEVTDYPPIPEGKTQIPGAPKGVYFVD